MTATFMTLINDDVDVLTYKVSNQYLKFFCVAEKGSDDIKKAFEETLYKLLAAGAYDNEIEMITGFTKNIIDLDDCIDIDLGYVLNGSVESIKTMKKDFHWFEVGDLVRVKTIDELLEVYKNVPSICQRIRDKREFAVGYGDKENEGFVEEMYSCLGKIYQIASISAGLVYQEIYIRSPDHPFEEGYWVSPKWLNELAHEINIEDLEDLI